MRSMNLVTTLSLFSLAQSKALDISIDKLVDQLFERVFSTRPILNGKFRHLAFSQCTSKHCNTRGGSDVGAGAIYVKSFRTRPNCGILCGALCSDSAQSQNSVAATHGRRHTCLTAALMSFATALTSTPAFAKEEGASFGDDALIDGPEGIKYVDLTVGDGDEPQIPYGYTVRYILKVPSTGGTQMGTKSFPAGKRLPFPGFDYAVMGQGDMPPMREGGIRKVLIQPKLAYGEFAQAFSTIEARTLDQDKNVYFFIPANSVLEVYIELVKVSRELFKGNLGSLLVESKN